MAPWVLSDGTKVLLGGRVEGETSLADKLRSYLRDAKESPTCAFFGDCPHHIMLDVNAPHLLDSFIRFYSVVKSAPEFETPILEPRPEPPNGGIY